MTYQQRQTISYLISTLLVSAGYAVYLLTKAREGIFDTDTIASSWGTTILVLIAIQVAVTIIVTILVTIIEAIRTRQEPNEFSDERDKLIELKANKASYSTFGIGFLLAMLALALGQAPLVMFNLIVFSMFASAIVGYITQLAMYRRGF